MNVHKMHIFMLNYMKKQHLALSEVELAHEGG